MGVDNPGLVGNAALRKRDIDGLELSMNELTNAPGLEYVGKSYPKLWFLSLAGNQMRGEVSLGGMFRGLACPGLGEKHPQWDVVAAVAHVGFIRRSVDCRTTIGSVWGLAERECLSGDELSGRVDVSQLLLSLRALRLSLNFLSGNIDLNFLSGNIDLSNLPPLMESLSLSLSWSQLSGTVELDLPGSSLVSLFLSGDRLNGSSDLTQLPSRLKKALMSLRIS